jgi:uncharacterized membrane protein YdfJ with MMPL/SSD domain
LPVAGRSSFQKMLETCFSTARSETTRCSVLLPAVMKLLGDAKWYLPKRLAWLPRLEHEPARA